MPSNEVEILQEIRASVESIKTALQGTMGPPATPGLIARMDSVEARLQAIETSAEWAKRMWYSSAVGGFITIAAGVAIALFAH